MPRRGKELPDFAYQNRVGHLPAEDVPKAYALVGKFDAALVAHDFTQLISVGFRDGWHLDISAATHLVDCGIEQALIYLLATLYHAFKIAKQNLGIANDGCYGRIAGQVVYRILGIIFSPHESRTRSLRRVVEALFFACLIVGAKAILRATKRNRCNRWYSRDAGHGFRQGCSCCIVGLNN